MRAARCWCLAAALAVAIGACGGGSQDDAASTFGEQVSFVVPVAPGSRQSLSLQGIVRGRGADGVVLAHMLGSNQNAWTPIVAPLLKEGFHILTFDFRGHALSGGNRNPSRADLDLAGAVAKLRSLGASRILIVGASMGGTAALKVAATADVAGVVSISGPAQIGTLDAAAAVGKLRCPSLFIVARDDAARYTDSARSLFAAASGPKTLKVIDGSSAHGTDLLTDSRGPQVEKLILDFLISHRG